MKWRDILLCVDIVLNIWRGETEWTVVDIT